MPHPRRLDFAGAIHLLRLRGRRGEHIFFEPGARTWGSAPRARSFMLFLEESLEACGSQLFGYHVESNAVFLLLRAGRVPVEKLMQRTCGAFGRYWRRYGVQSNPRRGPFAGRYQAKLIAPDYLPHALRRLHAMALQTGLRTDSAVYPFNSAQAYAGARSLVPLALEEVPRVLALKGFAGPQGYRHFMQQPETTHVAALLTHGARQDASIVGGRAYVLRAHDAVAHPAPVPPREQLIAAVARRLQVAPDEVITGPRIAVLARSMIAWYGLRTGAADLSEVARWFDVSAATVGRAMRHQRRIAPQFFSMPLPGLDDEPGTSE